MDDLLKAALDAARAAGREDRMGTERAADAADAAEAAVRESLARIRAVVAAVAVIHEHDYAPAAWRSEALERAFAAVTNDDRRLLDLDP